MADINNDAQSILTITQVLAANQAARFAYTSVAYDDDDAAGVASYDYTKEQNIPLKGEDYVMMKSGVLDKGLRTQGASLPREFLDHMLGRLSYNLNKLVDKFNALVTLYKTDLAQNANLYSPTASYSAGCVCFMLTTKNTTSLECEFFRCIASSSITGTPPISSGGVYDTANWEQCTYTKYSVDTMLASAIATEVTNRNSAIAVETAARTAADSNLNTAISNEASTRSSSDSNLNTAISNEASTRSSADAAIQSQINNDVLKNNLGAYAWSSIDSLTQCGVYRISSEDNTYTRTLLVFGTESGGSTSTIQYIFGFNAGYCQWRNKTDGNVWTSWKTVFNTQNIDSAPTSGSSRVPSSGGVYTAEQSKENFTFVVDSNAKLAAWAAATAGNDYTSVLIKKGTWSGTSAVDLTASGTIRVVGETGSVLAFTGYQGLLYSATYNAATFAKYSMDNVTITVTGTGAGTLSIFGMKNCANLRFCHVTNTQSGASYATTGFLQCHNLDSCEASASNSNSASNPGAYGFNICYTVNACKGAGTDTYGSANGIGFEICYGVSHCEKLSTSSGATFSEVYASNTSNSSYLAADSANGGFNNVA